MRMRRIFRMVVVLLWVGLLSGTAWPGTFYVSTTGSDSNPGSQALPWRTIGKAANTMTAGDATIVMDGTYEEDTVRFSNQGTVEMRITLKAQHSRNAILSSLSTRTCQPAINVHAGYVTIDGLRISTSPNASPCGVYSAANLSLRFWHDESYAVSINGRQDTGNIGGIIRDVQVDASPYRSLAVKASQDNMLVENSLFYDQVEMFNNNGAIIQNNTFIGADRDWNDLVVVKAGARNTQVYNNVVHIKNSTNTGLLLGGTTGTQWMYDAAFEAYNAVAYNNVVLNESGSSINLVGFSGCKNCAVFNNTIIGGRLHMRSGGAGTGNQNTTVKNNILMCNNGAALGQWDGLWSGTLTVDYNDFYQCPGPPSQAHAVVGDPKFVNPASDWHLQSGSPGIGTGTTINTTPAYGGGTLDTSHDKDGLLRTAPWSLGIYSSTSPTDTTPPAAPTNLRSQ